MTERWVTVFSNEESAALDEYGEKFGIARFSLLKMAVREFVKNHPKGPPVK